jgi:hypothetical protein
LLGKPATAFAVCRFDRSGVETACANELPCAVEAAGVADLGEQVTGEDRADAEDRLQRLAAPVGASEAAQFALEQLELFVERRHH